MKTIDEVQERVELGMEYPTETRGRFSKIPVSISEKDRYIHQVE